MWIYILLNLLIIILGISTYSRKRNPKYSMIFLVVVMILIAGFRGDFTQDYNNYAQYFLRLKDISFSEIIYARNFSMERGFLFIGKLIRIFTDKIHLYFLIISTLTITIYYKTFRKYSKILYVTLLLFVSVGDYYASFNLCRQTLAAAISFYGIRYICDEKGLPKYIVCILGAFLIHRSAIIMLPMYFLLKREVTFKYILSIGGIGICLYVLMPYVIKIVQYVFPIYRDYVYGMSSGSFNAVIPILAMTIMSLICIKLLKCDFEIQDLTNRALINGSIWACLFLILGIRVYMITRIAYFFKPFSWILVSNVIYACKKRNERILMIFVISILAFLFVWITLSHTAYNPYYFYWE